MVTSYRIQPGDDTTSRSRRRLAEALMSQGMESGPVEHWTQGVGRMAKALAGGYALRKLDEKDSARDREAAELLGKHPALGGGVDRLTKALYPQDQPQTPDVPQDGDVTSRIINVESGGNPNAKNPRSSATGPGQFIDSTWLETVRKNRPDLAGQPDAMLLGMRSDPELSREMTTAYADENNARLQQAGLPVTPGNTYLAHFAGPGGAQKILTADPNAPVETVMSPQAMQANPFLKGMTVGDLRAWSEKKMGGGQQQETQVAQAPQQVAQASTGQMNPQLSQYIRQLLANPATRAYGAQLLAAHGKPQQPTAAMQEFQYGQQNPAFAQRQVDLKRASRPQVTVDQRGENEFSKEAGKLQAKRFSELAEGGAQAQQMISDIEMLRTLGSQIGTGKGAEIMGRLGPYAKAMGVDVEGLDEIQAYEAIVNRLAPNLRVKGSGAQSDFELRNFMKSLPQIGNTPGGNEIASRVLQGLFQNKLAAAEIGARALNGEMSRTEAEKALRELPDPMKDYREFIKSTKPEAAKRMNELRQKYGLE